MFKKENLFTTVFVIVIALLVGLAIAASVFNKEEILEPLKTTTDFEFAWENQPLIGEKDAPVSLNVFYDYNCSHCQQWDEQVLPIIETEIIEKGIANMHFVNYQFMQPTSVYAGMAGELVHATAPDKFLAFHKDLYSNQLAINVDYLSEKVNEYVPTISVEQAKNDLVSQKYIDQVLSDKKHGESMGVTGTPSLYINDVRVENAGDLAEIIEKINEESQKVAEVTAPADEDSDEDAVSEK